MSSLRLALKQSLQEAEAAQGGGVDDESSSSDEREFSEGNDDEDQEEEGDPDTTNGHDNHEDNVRDDEGDVGLIDDDEEGEREGGQASPHAGNSSNTQSHRQKHHQQKQQQKQKQPQQSSSPSAAPPLPSSASKRKHPSSSSTSLHSHAHVVSSAAASAIQATWKDRRQRSRPNTNSTASALPRGASPRPHLPPASTTAHGPQQQQQQQQGPQQQHAQEQQQQLQFNPPVKPASPNATASSAHPRHSPTNAAATATPSHSKKSKKSSSSTSTTANTSTTAAAAAATASKKSKKTKVRTVVPPLPHVLAHIQSLPTKTSRRSVVPGLRVKVRFGTPAAAASDPSSGGGGDVATANTTASKKKTTQWYGGRISAVSKEGSKIRIKYDDGTVEVTKFPDPDVIVDDTGNGQHAGGPALAFVAPSPSLLPSRDDKDEVGAPVGEENKGEPPRGAELTIVDGGGEMEAESEPPLLPPQRGSEPPPPVEDVMGQEADGDPHSVADASVSAGAMGEHVETSPSEHPQTPHKKKKKKKKKKVVPSPDRAQLNEQPELPQHEQQQLQPPEKEALELLQPQLEQPDLDPAPHDGGDEQRTTAPIPLLSATSPSATAMAVDPEAPEEGVTAMMAAAPPAEMEETALAPSPLPRDVNELHQSTGTGQAAVTIDSHLNAAMDDPMQIDDDEQQVETEMTPAAASEPIGHTDAPTAAAFSNDALTTTTTAELHSIGPAATVDSAESGQVPAVDASTALLVEAAMPELSKALENNTNNAATSFTVPAKRTVQKSSSFTIRISKQDVAALQAHVQAPQLPPIADVPSEGHSDGGTEPPIPVSGLKESPTRAPESSAESNIPLVVDAAPTALVMDQEPNLALASEKEEPEVLGPATPAPDKPTASTSSKRLHIVIPKAARRDENNASVATATPRTPLGAVAPVLEPVELSLRPVDRPLTPPPQPQHDGSATAASAVASVQRSPRPKKSAKRKTREGQPVVSGPAVGDLSDEHTRKRQRLEGEPTLQVEVGDGDPTAVPAVEPVVPAVHDKSEEELSGGAGASGRLTPRPRASQPKDAAGSSQVRSGRRAAREANERIVARPEPGATVPGAEGANEPAAAAAATTSSGVIAAEAAAAAAVTVPSHKKKKRKLPDDEEPAEPDEAQWAQCDKCAKWRVIPAAVVASLPQQWYCADNVWDPKRASCDAPEQTAKQAAKEKKRRKRLQQQRLAAAEAAATASLGVEPVGAPIVEPVVEPEVPHGGGGGTVKPKRASPVLELSAAGQTESHPPESISALRPTDTLVATSQAPPPGAPPRPEKKSSKKDDGPLVAPSVPTDAEAAALAAVDKKRGRGRPRRAVAEPLPKETKDPAKEPSARNNSQTSASQASQVDENQEWVRCDRCEKWRKLPPHVSADDLPDVWYCSLNTWNPASASCDAPEDKADGLQDVGFHSGSGAGKLSYRNLIFGNTGRKANRPVSERARAAESLFLAPNDDEDAPPTVMYANSSSFVSRSRNNAPDENRSGMSVLELMSHSNLWAELRGGAQNQPLAPGGTNAGGERLLFYTYDTLPADIRDAARALVLGAVGDKCLSSEAILRNAREQPSRARPFLSINVVVTCLYEMVKEGLVECVQVVGSDWAMKDWDLGYRRAKTYVCNTSADASTAKPDVHKASRCIKIAKPWKRAAL